MVNFGERLKQARENKGLTQQALAEQVFVTRQTVSRWENGTRYPDLMTTKLLANLLDVTIDSLVSEEEVKTFSEKQKWAGHYRYSKIITALYAIIAIFALLKWVPVLVEMIVGSVGYCNSNAVFNPEDLFLLTDYLTHILLYIAITVIAAIAFYNAVKNTTSTKTAGLIGSIFFGSLALNKLLVILFHGLYWQGATLFLIEVAFAVLIGLTLIGKYTHFIKIIYAGCTLSAVYFIINPIFKNYALQHNNYLSVLSLFALTDFSRMILGLAVTALVVIVTYTKSRPSQ